jgi:hypothetical protein
VCTQVLSVYSPPSLTTIARLFPSSPSASFHSHTCSRCSSGCIFPVPSTLPLASTRVAHLAAPLITRSSPAQYIPVQCPRTNLHIHNHQQRRRRCHPHPLLLSGHSPPGITYIPPQRMHNLTSSLFCAHTVHASSFATSAITTETTTNTSTLNTPIWSAGFRRSSTLYCLRLCHHLVMLL